MGDDTRDLDNGNGLRGSLIYNLKKASVNVRSNKQMWLRIYICRYVAI